MLKALRVALVVVATLSTTLVTRPLYAGMVTRTAAPSTAEDLSAAQGASLLREAASQGGITEAQLHQALASLSASQRVALVGHVDAMRHAGNFLGAALLVCGVVIVGVFLFSELLWDKGHLTKVNP